MKQDNAAIDQLLKQRPESLEELTAQITPAMHAELKSAVELRKFADGSRLSPEQLENCLQLVILYEGRHLPEHQRTGFDIPTSCKSQPGSVAGPAANGPVQMWGKD